MYLKELFEPWINLSNAIKAICVAVNNIELNFSANLLQYSPTFWNLQQRIFWMQFYVFSIGCKLNLEPP